MNTSEARQCGGKSRHRSRRAADRHAAHLAEQFGDLTVQAYRCPHCGHWHTGHAPPSQRRDLHYRRLLQLIDRANRKD